MLCSREPVGSVRSGSISVRQPAGRNRPDPGRDSAGRSSSMRSRDAAVEASPRMWPKSDAASGWGEGRCDRKRPHLLGPLRRHGPGVLVLIAQRHRASRGKWTSDGRCRGVQVVGLLRTAGCLLLHFGERGRDRAGWRRMARTPKRVPLAPPSGTLLFTKRWVFTRERESPRGFRGAARGERVGFRSGWRRKGTRPG